MNPFIVFIISAVVIGIVGPRMIKRADFLADKTGMGEALMGSIFLGAITSLPGITASATAAAGGNPELSLSNAFGGIAAQTVFLVIADITHKNINLEHAAPSLENLMQGTILIILLALLTFVMLTPAIDFFGIHPITPLLLIGYVMGMRMVYKSHQQPMWSPEITKDTILDEPEDGKHGNQTLFGAWTALGILSLVVIVAGWYCTKSAEEIADITGLPHSVVGAMMVAIATSLPELITSIAAIRAGALTLAISGVLGGNAFDTLFAAVADIFYLEGSIYQAVSQREILLAILTILMTAILILGLLHREKKGFGNIGFESSLVLLFYVVGLSCLFFI